MGAPSPLGRILCVDWNDFNQDVEKFSRRIAILFLEHRPVANSMGQYHMHAHVTQQYSDKEINFDSLSVREILLMVFFVFHVYK